MVRYDIPVPLALIPSLHHRSKVHEILKSQICGESRAPALDRQPGFWLRLSLLIGNTKSISSAVLSARFALVCVFVSLELAHEQRSRAARWTDRCIRGLHTADAAAYLYIASSALSLVTSILLETVATMSPGQKSNRTRQHRFKYGNTLDPVPRRYCTDMQLLHRHAATKQYTTLARRLLP